MQDAAIVGNGYEVRREVYYAEHLPEPLTVIHLKYEDKDGNEVIKFWEFNNGKLVSCG